MVVEWNADLYAQNTAHHRAYDDDVLAPLQIAPDWQILDVGSGAGDFSARLAALVPSGTVLGVDRSAPLVARAAADHTDVANLAFATHSAEDVGSLAPLALPSGRLTGPPFDLVISTATLHWVAAADHPQVYDGVKRVLRPGGIFRAEFGGFGQIAATVSVLNEESARFGGPQNPWNFPPPEEVTDALRAAGFSLDGGFVRLVNQIRAVPDRDALRGWLESQVLIAYETGLTPEHYATFCSRAIARLTEEARRDDGRFDQDYVRLDLLATVPLTS
jgi:trans-aconitate methyltransferase